MWCMQVSHNIRTANWSIGNHLITVYQRNPTKAGATKSQQTKYRAEYLFVEEYGKFLMMTGKHTQTI